MKLILAGTPDYALPTFEALRTSGHSICAVYTQPDRRAGRGQTLHASPVKQWALKHHLPVYQPLTLKIEAEQQTLATFAADLMVVVAYGLLLPPAVLSAPRLGCVNLHASLLPRWRGAAPIQWALLAGDTVTGVSLMQMEAGLDTGPVLAYIAYTIAPQETAASLHDRLAQASASLLLEHLPTLATQRLTPIPQDHHRASYAHKINKAQARLNWQQPAIELARQVRAFNPRPVAYTDWAGQLLRVWQAEALPEEIDPPSIQPGTVHWTPHRQLEITTGQGRLRLLEIQPANGKRMPAAAFALAHPLPPTPLS